MELQEQDIALLEAYLAGELAGEDLRSCEARLQAEPELAEALLMLRSMEQAASQTAAASLRKEMAIAQASAVAAGLSTYTPSINPPGGGFLGRLLRFLISLAVIGAATWLIWKYVMPHGEGDFFMDGGHIQTDTETKTTTTTTTKTTIHRDTVTTTGSGPKVPTRGIQQTTSDSMPE